MSSRRKSSNPRMVQVVTDLPEEQDDPEEVMDIETLGGNIVTEKEESSSSEPIEKTLQEISVNADPETFLTQVEKQNSEPLEQEEQTSKGDQAQTIADVVAGELKEKEGIKSDQVSQKKQSRGYECKYCPFLTQNLNDFKEHVDSSHPNVILNPQYLCAVCNFNTKKFDSLTEHNDSQHPGETNFKFKRIKMNNQTILEQTIEGKDNSAQCEMTNEQRECDSSSVFSPCISTTVKTPGHVQTLCGGTEPKNQLNGLIQKDQITAVNINGTVIFPDPTILQGLSHVTPMLQRPPNFNSVPKIAIPLNTTKYNPSLDDNLTLITSFNKFPYPTHAELSWLTAASKHPEEQIKVWFTTQRLKQGITWSPEEVEEARKKMFNGSIPPAHHTFTILPTTPISQSSAKASKQPIVHTTVEHPGRVQMSASNGLHVVTSNSPAGVSSGSSHSLKRSMSTHLTSVFSPESKRPIMAVAPHSGDPKDKVLMAPPPPPPPQKDRLPMPPPPVPLEMKRTVAAPLVSAEMKRPSVAVPLMPPPLPPSSSSPSLSSKGKNISTIGNHKTKPLVSLPSMVFPESLTRPMIAPPPIFAPPFKNSLLIPRTTHIFSKEKQANTHTLPTADSNLPNSPPLVNSQIRRPTIIQSIRTPAKAPSQIQGFPKEQQGMELKISYPKGDKVVSPLTEANGKWSQDHTSSTHNNGIIDLDGGEAPAARKPDLHHKSSVLTQFPLLERMKGKTAKQLKILEENFVRNSFPTHSDVDNLIATTGLSHQEISSWFVERRALRDNLEQALLNSMGTKRTGIGGIAGITEKSLQQQQQQLQSIQLNGIHKTTTSMGNLKSPPPPLHSLSLIAPNLVAPSIPNLNSCSVPPDSRCMALLKDDFAQTRWPSPEEFSQPEGRTGMARSELARWFTDTRLQSGSMELTELFHNNRMNGGQGHPVCSPESTPSSIIQRCQEGAVKNNSKVLDVELGWLMDQRSNSLNSQQHAELQERFAGRLRQQSVAELKNGGQNGRVMGGAQEVFGSWLEDGHLRRGRDLLLDRERKMAEDTSGRLTG